MIRIKHFKIYANVSLMVTRVQLRPYGVVGRGRNLNWVSIRLNSQFKTSIVLT